MKKIIALVAALSMCITMPAFSATTKKSVSKSNTAKSVVSNKTKAKKTVKKSTAKVSKQILKLDSPIILGLKDYDSSILLAWLPADDAKSYKILRGTTKGNLKVIASIKTTSFTDKNLAVENSYYYEIIACNGKINSSPSEIVARAGVPKSIVSQIQNGYTSLISNNGDYYFKASVKDSILTVDGKDLLKDDQWFEVLVKDPSKKEIAKTIVQRNSDGKFSAVLNMPLEDGSYYINILCSKTQNGEFGGIYLYIPLKCKNKNLILTSSPVCINNYKKICSINEDDMVNATKKVADEDISQKVSELTRGIKDPRQKIKAIHDWIADNIYYDVDFNKEKNNKDAYNKKADAENVFKSKRAICIGYANLFATMVREADIPCLVAGGYGINIPSDKAWGNITKEDNHAWNLVYLDGKWINVDVTWDSRNEYKDGKFVKGKKNYTFFDATLEFFSLTHKMVSIASIEEE